MRFPAAVAAALVLAALPAPAQAAGCVWTPSVLPGHSGVEHERVTGMSPDGSVTVGDAFNVTFQTLNGVIWRGTTPVYQADPNRGPNVDNAPKSVNDAGIVAGYAYDNNTGTGMPYRYNTQDGTYEWLQSPNNDATANFINDRGDVVGWYFDGRTTRTLFWRAGMTQPMAMGSGEPVGLDDEGRVTTSQGEVWSVDAHPLRIRDLRGALPRSYAYDTAVGVNNMGEIIEWEIRGSRTSRVSHVIEGANSVDAVNAYGVIGGTIKVNGEYHGAIWKDGELQDLGQSHVNGITDTGVAYGQQGWDPVVLRCS